MSSMRCLLRINDNLTKVEINIGILSQFRRIKDVIPTMSRYELNVKAYNIVQCNKSKVDMSRDRYIKFTLL